MIEELERRGPRQPLAATPPRAPGSVRRTSTIDTTWVDEPGGRRVVDGRARDLLTTPEGDAVVLDQAVLRARAEGVRRLTELEADPPAPELAALVGRMAGPGFRAALDEALPDEAATLSLRYLLLDDLPGASLVAGHAGLRNERPPGERLDDGVERADLCAGWAMDATIMLRLRDTGVHPAVIGPPAPALDVPGDPWAWHAMAPLPIHGMRRLRRLDVVAPDGPGGPHRFEVHFRDSHMDIDGVEKVVHEYTVSGEVTADGELAAVEAQPLVLPYQECPQAAASARRLAGRSVRGLRPFVRETFVGTTTCTHLNDTLRGLADLERLIALEAEARAGRSPG